VRHIVDLDRAYLFDPPERHALQARQGVPEPVPWIQFLAAKPRR